MEVGNEENGAFYTLSFVSVGSYACKKRRIRAGSEGQFHDGRYLGRWI